MSVSGARPADSNGVAPPEKPVQPTGWGRLMLLSLLVAWVVGFTAFTVWARARTFTLGYEVAKATADRRRLYDERQSLELERTSQRSPLRVGAAAAGKMGLRAPLPNEVIYLAIDGTPEESLP